MRLGGEGERKVVVTTVIYKEGVKWVSLETHDPSVRGIGSTVCPSEDLFF